MNRKLHNTFSALSVTALLMTAGLIVATPIPEGDRVVAVAAATASPMAGASELEAAADELQHQAVRVADLRAEALERFAKARTEAIEARAQRFEQQVERSASVGEFVGHLAGFTAEVAAEAAVAAGVEGLSQVEFTTIETTETDPAPAPSKPARKPRSSHRPLAMPYFSFASRG